MSGPVEYGVGLLRALGTRRADVRLLALAAACARQGQDLFYPPSVKGWDGGRRWLNSATLVDRANLANDVIWGNPDVRMAPFDARRWQDEHDSERGRPVDALIDVLLQDDVGPRARELIQDAGAEGNPDDLRRALQLIVLCSEFQLV